MFDVKVPEPPDETRVEFSLKVSATIGELKARDREATETMQAAIRDFFADDCTLEEVEAAIRARAEAGLLLPAAKARRGVGAITGTGIKRRREVSRKPASGGGGCSGGGEGGAG